MIGFFRVTLQESHSLGPGFSRLDALEVKIITLEPLGQSNTNWSSRAFKALSPTEHG